MTALYRHLGQMRSIVGAHALPFIAQQLQRWQEDVAAFTDSEHNIELSGGYALMDPDAEAQGEDEQNNSSDALLGRTSTLEGTTSSFAQSGSLSDGKSQDLAKLQERRKRQKRRDLVIEKIHRVKLWIGILTELGNNVASYQDYAQEV